MGKYPTVPVTVKRASKGVTDAYNVKHDVLGEPEQHMCLVSPGASEDFDGSRPDGARVAYTVITPKTLTGSLKGAHVSVPGDSAEYRVIGDPKPYPHGSLPAGWPFDRKFEVEHAEG